MKIIQLIQRDQKRGAEIFALQLAFQLRKLGHEVLSISLFEGGFNINQDSDRRALNRPDYLRFFDLKGWGELSGLINEFKPDLIQANASDTLKFAVFSRLIFGWKSTLVYRNANTISKFAPSGPKKWFNQWLLKRSDHIISVSEYCSQDLHNNFEISRQKVSTIEIGIENKLQEPLDSSLQSFLENSPVIIHIGSFVPEKNHAGLLRIFSSISKEIPNVKLFLVGEGKLKSAIRQQAEEMGLFDSIQFIGAVENVYPLLKSSNILLLPSLIEGLPAVILEAMYCNCPVIAYKTGGIPDLIQHNQNGFLAEQGDEQQMAMLAIDLLKPDNLDLIDSVKKNAHQTVTSYYLIEQIAIRFEEVYKILITSNSRS